MSDWQGTMSTISPITGLDMNMPGDIFLLLEGDSAATGSWWGQNLTSYVQNDTIPEARLDDMATRILAAWYLLGQDSPDYPATNFDSFDPLDDSINAHIDVQDDHADLVRTIGACLHYSPEEQKMALFLSPERSEASSWLAAMLVHQALDQTALQINKVLKMVFWLWAGVPDVALVFIAADSGEGALSYVAPNPIEPNQDGDRLNLTAWHSGEDLILAVAEQNDNTIVVVNSVGPLIVESWIDHPNVTAVLWAGLQGSETGNAITDVLYGDWNPSGRLPYTIAKSVEDYSAHLVVGGGPDDIISVDYTEGDLTVTAVESSEGSNPGLEDAWAQGKATPLEFGASTALWLHRPAFNVTFNVQNTGDRYGGEIPQLYLNMPSSSGEPPSLLKGFTDIAAAPGETRTVSILLSRYDASIWDTEAQGWRRPDDEIGITVGRSSRDGKLVGKLPL
ncbi:hypothetical protein VNI00_012133 [Paramarasmius palmivorus]|uniref:beta-glucosidase n=1 Tax=Paramarasmius palmivorus TaxID=297713 RepID=A0AAW0C696_9AGAR